MVILKARKSTLRFSFLIQAILFAILFSACSSSSKENVREIQAFNDDWKFILSDGEYSDEAVEDSKWRILNLPHDWSIEGEFKEDHPSTAGGGALPGGCGWYRKYFKLPQADSSKNIWIHFDGIYWNSEVYINGILLGKRPNGYISFKYDMSPYLHYGDKQNVIAVKADNYNQPNSRWYSGSGIYRNVKLIKTDKIFIEFNETYIHTPHIDENIASLIIESAIVNSSLEEKELSVTIKIISPNAKLIAEESIQKILKGEENTFIEAKFDVSSPSLWSTDDPNLYSLEIELVDNGKIIDRETTYFGIRSFRFDIKKGFFLNEKARKILGVCMHHDLGALGSAVNRRAIERQLEILKEMGCNAIRTAHNPPAPELLELCDEMGFLVMDETFDMWKKKKSPYDYSQYWDEWHEKDLKDHIRRDRNHASVFMWSIGNEILEQWDSSGIEITKELYQIVRSLDTTRQIVSGNNSPFPGNMLLEADVMDVIGYNYKHEDFEKFPKTWPGKSFLATETTSGLMTRGKYDMPSDSIRRWPYRWDRPFLDGNPDNTVSSYDNVSTPWGSTHEETWSIIKKHDYLSGMFIWTGFDYLGEPTPFTWPSRSSYFGIIDLAGFPKDVYYMYKSEWTDEPVLHLFPHWNWIEGEKVDVLAYTNCSSVELFLNGKSIGERENADTVFHLKWEVDFEPGELKAVGKLPGGEIMESSVQTAGAPARIEVIPDRSRINADGNDLSFLTVNVLDENGVLVPYAENSITCVIEGEGKVVGVDNGNQVSHESFKTNYRKAFNGKCLFIVQAGTNPGILKLKFTSDHMHPVEVNLDMI
jgi:beta-galactosidase